MNIFTQDKRCICEAGEIFGRLYIPESEADRYPAVILSHGFNCVGDSMADVARELAENGFVAYTFDYRGGSNLSRSSGSTLEMSVESERRDLCRVTEMISGLDITDDSRIYLYGESQGGFVAALTAAEMPEKIARMFLLYPAFCIPDQWLSKDSESMSGPFEFFGGVKLSKAFYDGVPRYDVFERMRNYSNPVLIYHGSCDEVVDVSYSERLAREFPNAELNVVKGAGHGFNEKDRQAVRRAVLGFFSED